MSDARREILEKLKQHASVERVALPEVWHAPTGAQALGWHDFAEALIESHGEFHGPIPRARLADFLQQSIGERYATTRSAAEWLQEEHQPLSRAQLDGVDWMISVGKFAVARNGAVAVSSAEAPVRVELLLSESLVLLVPADALLQDLDQIYQRCGAQSRDYLTLICGPSKTADIEQTLVKGAHGPRRLLVVCVSD